MQLPLFYSEKIGEVGQVIELDEDNSRHIVQVLRMQEGDLLHLTDGLGHLMTAEISHSHKKHATVQVKQLDKQERHTRKVCMAVSLLKNNNRLEWFFEKAAEMGVHQIVPLLCDRTEKPHFKTERFRSILISAMLQSQQSWLTELGEPQKFSSFIKTVIPGKGYIAHCLSEDKKIGIAHIPSLENIIMLIGPEGDFTPNEIALAMEQGCQPVSLGKTRLRTETAALVASTFLCIS